MWSISGYVWRSCQHLHNTVNSRYSGYLLDFALCLGIVRVRNTGSHFQWNPYRWGSEFLSVTASVRNSGASARREYRHLDRPTIDTRSTSRSTDFQFPSTLYRMAIDASDDHTFDVGRRVHRSLRSAVGSMSVVCQWYMGGMSVMYSSQCPSSSGGTVYSAKYAVSVRSKI